LLYIQVKREDEASLYSQHQQNFEPSNKDYVAANVVRSLSSETVLDTIAISLFSTLQSLTNVNINTLQV